VTIRVWSARRDSRRAANGSLRVRSRSVPRLQTALLCNAATTETTGLVSMLGAFVDNVNVGQFPAAVQLWFVARLQWDDTDYGQTHTVVIKVEHPDGEQLVRIDGSADAQLNPGVDPEMPVGGALVVPLMTQFRREGRYEVSLTVNGDLFWMSPLRVRSALPQV